MASATPPKQKAVRSDSANASSSKKKPVRRAKSDVDGSATATASATMKKTKKQVDRHKSLDSTGPVTTEPIERPKRRVERRENVDATTTPVPLPTSTSKKEKNPSLSTHIARSKAPKEPKELEGTGATNIVKKPRRPALTRQHSFDGATTPSNLALHSEQLRRTSTEPTPLPKKKKPSKKQPASTSLAGAVPPAAAVHPAAAVPSAAAAAAAATNKRKVQFGASVAIPPPEINPKAKPLKDSDIWYSKEDLKILMDYELQISMRRKNGKHNSRCCPRGIEHIIEGRDVGAKVKQYVRSVIQQQSELKDEKIQGDDRAKQLRTFCQYFTKEDRKRATKLGFQDASEVSVLEQQEKVFDSFQSNHGKASDAAATCKPPRRMKSQL